MSRMPDGNTAALKLYEAQQARADRDFKDYGGEALDDVVGELLSPPHRLRFDVREFLEDQKDLAELVYLAWIENDWTRLADVLEARLREKLRDSEIVEDRAAELAQDAEYFRNGEAT